MAEKSREGRDMKKEKGLINGFEAYPNILTSPLPQVFGYVEILRLAPPNRSY